MTDHYCMRNFSGLSLSVGGIPDETVISRNSFFTTIYELLTEQGLMLHQGMIVDASIISAPSSTKNSTHSRDPEMRSTKKGNNWHFGMKAHIGVDFETGLAHTTTCTSANGHDMTQTHALLHGKEEYVFGDSGYIYAEKRLGLKDTDFGYQQRAIKDEETRELVGAVERTKASIRAQG